MVLLVNRRVIELPFALRVSRLHGLAPSLSKARCIEEAALIAFSYFDKDRLCAEEHAIRMYREGHDHGDIDVQSIELAYMVVRERLDHLRSGKPSVGTRAGNRPEMPVPARIMRVLEEDVKLPNDAAIDTTLTILWQHQDAVRSRAFYPDDRDIVHIGLKVSRVIRISQAIRKYELMPKRVADRLARLFEAMNTRGADLWVNERQFIDEIVQAISYQKYSSLQVLQEFEELLVCPREELELRRTARLANMRRIEELAQAALRTKQIELEQAERLNQAHHQRMELEQAERERETALKKQIELEQAERLMEEVKRRVEEMVLAKTRLLQPPENACGRCGEQEWLFDSVSPNARSSIWICSFCDRKSYKRVDVVHNSGAAGRTIPRSVEREVWRRDGGRCANCSSIEKIEYDHIIPVSRGGSNTARNVQLLCQECNRRKSGKAPDEL